MDFVGNVGASNMNAKILKHILAFFLSLSLANYSFHSWVHAVLNVCSAMNSCACHVCYCSIIETT